MKAEAKYIEMKTKSSSSSDGYKSDDNSKSFSVDDNSDNNSSTCYTDDRDTGSRSRFGSPDTCTIPSSAVAAAAAAVVRRISPAENQQQQHHYLQQQQLQHHLSQLAHHPLHHNISSLTSLKSAEAAAAVAAAAAAAAAAIEQHPSLSRLASNDLHNKLNNYFTPTALLVNTSHLVNSHPLSVCQPPIHHPPQYAFDAVSRVVFFLSYYFVFGDFYDRGARSRRTVTKFTRYIILCFY